MSLLSGLVERRAEMVAALEALVAAESPTNDPGACRACADVVEKLALDLLGKGPDRIEVGDRTHLRWRFGGATKVVLIGHFDTVWPLGTTDRWPFRVEGDSATGPGSFDMKAGVVQILFALSALADLDGVAIVLNSDEETGSPTSRDLIRETVLGAKAALVAEPSGGGSLKTVRKGVSAYLLRVGGRAAHAGLEPEKGINAVVELAHQIVAIHAMEDPDLGTTVTPSVVTGGTTGNTVPGSASVHVDVRAVTAAEQERVDAALRDLEPVIEGAALGLDLLATTAPLEHSSSADLYALAGQIADDLGLPSLSETTVGGGSDGNFTASLGIPTLDGLGAVGDNAHAEGEWVSIPAMAERAALLAGLVDRLRA
jgi:glutamate carboxypeptidase